MVFVVETAAKEACRMFGYWEWTKFLAASSDTYLPQRPNEIYCDDLDDYCCRGHWLYLPILHWHFAGFYSSIPPGGRLGMTRTATMSATAVVRP